MGKLVEGSSLSLKRGDPRRTLRAPTHATGEAGGGTSGFPSLRKAVPRAHPQRTTEGNRPMGRRPPSGLGNGMVLGCFWDDYGMVIG